MYSIWTVDTGLVDCVQQNLQDALWQLQKASPAREGVVAQVQGLHDEAAGEALRQGTREVVAACRESVEGKRHHAEGRRNAARGRELVSWAGQGSANEAACKLHRSSLMTSPLPTMCPLSSDTMDAPWLRAYYGVRQQAIQKRPFSRAAVQHPVYITPAAVCVVTPAKSHFSGVCDQSSFGCMPSGRGVHEAETGHGRGVPPGELIARQVQDLKIFQLPQAPGQGTCRSHKHSQPA